jgi:small-conductance mechanosensitive channel
MPAQPLESSFIAWVAALLIAPPLAVLVLTEVIVRVSQQYPRLGRTIVLFRNVVLPLLLIRLILQFVLGMHPTEPTVVAVETVFLLVLLYALLALLNLFIQGLASPAAHPAVEASAPFPPPKLFQLQRVWGEALRTLIVGGVALYLLNIVWGVPLNQTFVVLGGALIVLAISLQETLNGLFAGLLLAFEKPFEVGHWIRCGPYEGRILEMSWHSVRLSTRERDIVVIPNRLLNKEVVVNYSLHDPLHAENIQVNFPAEYPPNQIKEVLHEVALSTPGVIPQPPPPDSHPSIPVQPGRHRILYQNLCRQLRTDRRDPRRNSDPDLLCSQTAQAEFAVALCHPLRTRQPHIDPARRLPCHSGNAQRHWIFDPSE